MSLSPVPAKMILIGIYTDRCILFNPYQNQIYTVYKVLICDRYCDRFELNQNLVHFWIKLSRTLDRI